MNGSEGISGNQFLLISCLALVVLWIVWRVLKYLLGKLLDWLEWKRKRSFRLPEWCIAPRTWPEKKAYKQANKRFWNIMFGLTKLSVAGDILFINLWLIAIFLAPFMLVIALPIWLIEGLPNHWLWYNLRRRRR